MKLLILFGTRHYSEKKIPAETKCVLQEIIAKFKPQAVLEEWSITQLEPSGASIVAQEANLPWKNIGTGPLPEFETYGVTHALDFPSSANLPLYGPVEVQEKREVAMCSNITVAMEEYQTAVVVIGLAHLHSMMFKLMGKFKLKGYAYQLELW